MKLALDLNAMSQLLFKKLISTISEHLTDKDRMVAVEAIKCASLVFTRVEVRMLLIFIEDFLKQII